MVMPSSRSSSLSAADRAGCETWQLSAARPKCRFVECYEIIQLTHEHRKRTFSWMKGKHFFFEKKKQKTFVPCSTPDVIRLAAFRSRSRNQKFFGSFF
jgi:hypothetical protein